MSKTTTVNAIPYPEDSDVPNGPAQIKALAELLDTLQWGSRNLKPTVGKVSASGALAPVTEVETLIPGMILEITPAVDSYLIVHPCYKFFVDGKAKATVRMVVNGANQAFHDIGHSGEKAGESDIGINVGLTELITMNAATKYTIEFKAKQSEGGAPTNDVTIEQSNTQFVYQLVSR